LIDQKINKLSKKEDRIINKSFGKDSSLSDKSFENDPNLEIPKINISHTLLNIDESQLGIKKNINLNILINNGWQLVYFKGYNHYSNNLELNNIKSDYIYNNSLYLNTLICIGAINESIDSNKIVLCGIDFISKVFEETNSITEANQGSNSIFWYWVTYKSFGFAPNKRIFLSCADNIDIGSCDSRISWCVHGTCGGSRLGGISGLTKSNIKKIILVKILNS